MVDWRQVRRWRIDERAVPSGTVVAYREPTVWERYRVRSPSESRYCYCRPR